MLRANRTRADKPKVTHDEVLSLLQYDLKTGEFVWLERLGCKAWNTRYAGKVAGRLNDQGYVIIEIFDKPYRAHQLAWFYVTSDWIARIDHEDTDRSNNAWLNLREATIVQNAGNSRRHKDSLSTNKCVYFYPKRNKWLAKICINYKQKYLGYFDSEIEAVEAYKMAAEAHFGEFARVA